MTLFKANCLRCKRWYMSRGAKDDFGQCQDCNLKEAQELLNLREVYSKKPRRKIYPRWLDKQIESQILVFHKANLKHSKRLHALAVVNEKFNLSLTLDEFGAVLSKFYNQ